MWYCPWAATYDAARQTFIKAFQHFPQIIVYCAGFSVVVASIRFAQEVGLHPVYRSGGHNAGGYSVSDEMVIDLSNISYLRIDPKKESDLAGAGVNFGGVNPEMDLYGAACAGRRLPDGLRRRLHRGPRLRLHLSAVRYELRLGDGYADGVDGRADCERGNADEHQDLFWGAAPAIISGPCWRSNPACKKLGPVWGFGFKWPLKDDIRRPPLLKPSTLLRNV